MIEYWNPQCNIEDIRPLIHKDLIEWVRAVLNEFEGRPLTSMTILQVKARLQSDVHRMKAEETYTGESWVWQIESIDGCDPAEGLWMDLKDGTRLTLIQSQRSMGYNSRRT